MFRHYCAILRELVVNTLPILYNDQHMHNWQLSHSYMFRHYRVILRELVVNTLPSYTRMCVCIYIYIYIYIQLKPKLSKLRSCCMFTCNISVGVSPVCIRDHSHTQHFALQSYIAWRQILALHVGRCQALDLQHDAATKGNRTPTCLIGSTSLDTGSVHVRI